MEVAEFSGVCDATDEGADVGLQALFCRGFTGGSAINRVIEAGAFDAVAPNFFVEGGLVAKVVADEGGVGFGRFADLLNGGVTKAFFGKDRAGCFEQSFAGGVAIPSGFGGAVRHFPLV